jgi:hypothetical protein
MTDSAYSTIQKGASAALSALKRQYFGMPAISQPPYSVGFLA